MNQVSSKAKIAKGVNVGPFTTIYDDVVVGENTWIGPNVTIFNGVTIGKNCRIFPGAVIGAVPQDLKYKDEKTKVEIGDHTTIRECVTINLATDDKWVTRVGSHCLIMAYAHIAHDCQVGNHCILANSVNLAGHVEIDDWAILEGLVAVQQFTRIGGHVFIAGGSLIRSNVPPFIRAAKEPLTFIGVNSIGLSRRGFSKESIKEIEDLYRLLYVHNSNISKGIKAAREQGFHSKESDAIINFIESSTNGVIRGPR